MTKSNEKDRDNKRGWEIPNSRPKPSGESDKREYERRPPIERPKPLDSDTAKKNNDKIPKKND
jgi:hypothetical protein